MSSVARPTSIVASVSGQWGSVRGVHICTTVRKCVQPCLHLLHGIRMPYASIDPWSSHVDITSVTIALLSVSMYDLVWRLQ